MQMRAATYHKSGEASDVLSIIQCEKPEPGPGQVLVRVSFSAVNPSDVKTRSGKTPRPIDDFQIPHMDGCGRIVAVGPGVHEGRIGQRVWLWLAALGSRWGTAAEYTLVPANQAVALPDSASDELGACLGIPAMTAHECLLHAGPVTHKKVLIAGGAGAVGHFAIELARWAGATVIATVSTPDKAKLARQAGADFVVNYRDDDVADQITAFTNGVDIFVEVAIVDNWNIDLAVAAPGASIATYATDGRELSIPIRECMAAGLGLRFFLLYTHSRSALSLAAQSITDALAEQALTPLPHLTFPLDEIALAHEAVENGESRKVLLDLRDSDT
ncbi:NADPH:quinone reductase (plasmid) [Rhodococcus qingshengii]|jgi:NADPH:quinone reductase|uniref:NADPH:quinone reductase n=5 Tax=Nocardiaceae TaxID=85025 RepID=A0A974VX49_9NOCA|nr:MULTISPECIES: NADPH:quinone reductase [Rhodococcus]QXC46734.1 NADPH:quinone reductase [Rhodococcus qingshengii]AAP74057.1 putative quinone oxidoreductase [Rhodococcus erythropolis]QSE72287.1 NADPH:quinone reductase [Rhodococcus sp. PSBB049]QSE72553.1 NADPH:quinone reductase [Rhodococcus sp. PSBB049]QSE87383.1 NADPH:quinone reductase [Rhodococcus pseudokoreensis]